MRNLYKPSVVIGSAPRSLPDSLIEWAGTSEAQGLMRQALEDTLRKLADLDKARVVPRESLDRPLSTI